ncbi:hypothetical protein FHX49_002570 [Microbacterium endophyticum]|uniref:DUF3093 domain-containing protein n=1 Tax=Microbacterium endophyticum TaxID=1526412 RepID=A0A7W4V510_9MICO|nr:DUF3093 domain-containing protein [Microbacterium endophyticum]MBB2976978.1 hypothetical protein [Microbacterium endophyticum]NIK36736.1 hypothetical protein [Microbacterium endophyticum]
MTIVSTRQPAATYRERLSPSLWMIVAAAICAPMAALVFVPLGAVVALIVGVMVAVVIITGAIALSPVIELRDGFLHVGRAKIDVEYLGEPAVYLGEDARTQRGPGLDSRSWHFIRGGIDGILVVPVDDEDDPVPTWVFSTRTPERVASAIRRAKVTPRTPHR